MAEAQVSAAAALAEADEATSEALHQCIRFMAMARAREDLELQRAAMQFARSFMRAVALVRINQLRGT